MDEHRWSFRVGPGPADSYRAVRGQGYPYARIEILEDGEWMTWCGQPVATEMLRLATENKELRGRLAELEERFAEACDHSVTGPLRDDSWPAGD